MIRSVAESLKLFLDKRIIRIARERDTKKPIGFCICLLDYNQVFKATKGTLNPFKLLFAKRYINRARVMMQFVIPEFEAGTMMEGNDRPLHSFDKFGGKIAKTYRLYGKEVAHD